MFTSKNNQSQNEYFMNLALMQAYKSLGNTGNNPAVGCVIVKDSCVVSSGNTGFKGRPHAEHKALNFKDKLIKNSSLYVTLEPCSHYGKTFPCVNKIIRKRIKKVFFSVKDPDLRSFNKCVKILKKNKVKTNIGLLSNKIKKFYLSYYKSKKDLLPYVTGKIAVSKDFFTANKKNKWITNQHSRKRVHLIRSRYDSILTSAETVIKDNSLLNCRIPGLEDKSPVRILIDKSLKIPLNSKIVKTSSKIKTIIFYNKLKKGKIKYLKNNKIKLIRQPLDSNLSFNLKNVIIKIKKLGYSRIFLECGVDLMSNFLNDNLVDDFNIFVSSKKLKKNGFKSFKTIFNKNFIKKDFKIINVNLFGDKLLYYRVK